jgi:hypothetical protein
MPWPVGPVDTRTKLDDLATPDDNRDLNATVLRHGLLPKLSGDVARFLNGLGLWVEPGGSGGGVTPSAGDFIDSLLTVRDDVTPGKTLQLQLDGLAAGNHTYRPPPSAAASTDTLAALGVAQTFTEDQTIAVGKRLIGPVDATGGRGYPSFGMDLAGQAFTP